MKKLLFLILSISILQLISAQQYNNWCFGNNAGISFNANGSGPVPYALPLTNMIADEGCASVSDASGNLLFYTNGKKVYNKHKIIMQGGDSLYGHPSAQQSSLIVPMPGNDNLFYIFTADAIEDGYTNSYYYSVVDMSLDNGDGVVTTRNALLYTTGTERITAIRSANGIDVWVISNDKSSNIFRAWLITCGGLQGSPVVSTIGRVLNGGEGIGDMKASPDGKKLCQTAFPADPDNVGNIVQLFDFNTTTGVLSNPQAITVGTNQYYNCAFSANSKMLYLTKSTNNEIDQFDISQPTTAQIIASRFVVNADYGFYGIQLAPDKKIYLGKYGSTKLSVISSPDIPGAGCQLQLSKISLDNGSSLLNLPNAINDWPFDPYNYFNYQFIDTCTGLIQFNGFTSLPSPVQWHWDFGDGNTSTIQNPTHTYAQKNQMYNVTLTLQSSSICGKISRSLTIAPQGIFAKADFSFAIECDSANVKFTNQSIIIPDGVVQYTWSFGDGNNSNQQDPTHVYAGPGLYTVRLKMETGTICLADSIAKILDFRTLVIQAPPDQTINEGQSIQLPVTGGGSSFSWSPVTWLSNPHSSSPVASPLDDITYEVTATNDAGCKAVDSVSIHVIPLTDIYVPTAFTPNNDGLNDVLKPIVGHKFSLVQFIIYNRWGEKVFSTSEKGKGWDGRINGRLQNTGSYVWIIQVKDDSGKLIEKKGMITLIK